MINHVYSIYTKLLMIFIFCILPLNPVLWKGLAKIKKLSIDLQVKRKTLDDVDGKFHNDIDVSFSAKITIIGM